MGIKYGKNGRLYYDTAGVDPDPSLNNWVYLSKMTDVNSDTTKSTDDVTTRDGDGWRQYAPGLKEATVSFNLIKTDNNPGFDVLEDSYLNDTVIAIAVMDGDLTTSGSRGLVADMVVIDFKEEQPLEGAIKISVTLQPALSDVAPKIYKVA